MKKLLIILLLFASPAFAEDPEGVYVLDAFDGGLNTKLSPFSLPKDQADITENVRFNSKLKSISKRDALTTYGTADNSEKILGMHRFYLKDGTKVLLVNHGDEIEKGNDTAGTFSSILDLTIGDKKWQWVTWHDLAIGTDGDNQPVKYDGSSASATFLGTALATVASTGGACVNGVRTYKVSYYTTSFEILFDVESNQITCDGNDISLSMIPIGLDTFSGESVVGRRIYRNKETVQGTWFLLSNGDIANNTAVILTDSDTDAQLSATVYPAGDATYTPPQGRFILVHKNRLIVSNDPNDDPSRLFYSEDGSHDVFVTNNAFDIRQNDGDEITFVNDVLGVLTIGKTNSIQKLYTTGDSPSADWSISDPFSFIGCQAPYTAVWSPLGIIYLGRDGIYTFNGQFSKLISEAVTPEIQDISETDYVNTWGVYHDNIYQMAYTSDVSGEDHNNRVLVFDILDNAYSIDLLDVNAFTVFSSSSDGGILYAGSSTDGKVFAYAQRPYELVHRRHSDFVGLFDDTRLIPVAVGGDTEDPIIEIARTEDIDDLTTIIDSLTGLLDRQDFIGHYVSQPISTSASAFDKIFWNEVIPLTGGDVTFQMRTSPTGEENVLLNDDMEWWDNWAYDTDTTVRPNDWTFTSSGPNTALATISTTAQRGSFSASAGTAATTYSAFEFAVPNATLFQGRTMVFDGWVRSDNTTNNRIFLQIDQGVAATTASTIYYANSGDWENIATTMTVSATATTLTVRMGAETGSTAFALFDQVMLIPGTTAKNDWTAWSTSVTDPSGSDISGVTADTFAEYHIEMSTDDLKDSPNLVKGSNFVVFITYQREGAVVTDSIPLMYRTGWIDLNVPDKKKTLKWIYSYHNGTAGTLRYKIENYLGDIEIFDINLTQTPTFYKEAFTAGKFPAQLFRMTITHDDLSAVEIDKIVLIYDVEPLGWQ